MEFNTTKVGEEKEMINLNVVSSDASQNCQCNELDERSKKAELRCAELEIELQKKKDHCEELEAKVKVLEKEKLVAEDKLKVVKTSSEGLRRQGEVSSEKKREIKPIVDLEENNEAVQLLTQIKDLECQKERAESEVEVWKDKFKKLESWALQLGMGRGNYYHEENGKKKENQQKGTEGNLHLDADFDFQQNQEKVADLGNVVSSCISPFKEIGYIQLAAGTPSNGIVQRSPILDSIVQPDSKIVKQLAFETEESPSKKMNPSIPISGKSASVNVIDIIDSDDEPNITQNLVQDRQGSGNMSVSTCFATEKQKNSESSYAQNNEEDLDFGEDLKVATTKRKRTCNVVTSESESDDDNDDNIPICKLKRRHFQDVSANRVRPNFNSSLTVSEDDKVTDTKKIRRRLQPLRNCATKSVDEKTSSCRPHKAKHQKSSPTNDDADDDQSEEDLSYSEGEDMGDFIVDDSGL